MSRIGEYRKNHPEKIPTCIICGKEAHCHNWHKRTGEPIWRKYCIHCHEERRLLYEKK